MRNGAAYFQKHLSYQDHSASQSDAGSSPPPHAADCNSPRLVHPAAVGEQSMQLQNSMDFYEEPISFLFLPHASGNRLDLLPQMPRKVDATVAAECDALARQQFPLGRPSGRQPSAAVYDAVTRQSFGSIRQRTPRAPRPTGPSGKPRQLSVRHDPARRYLTDDVVDLGVEIRHCLCNASHSRSFNCGML